MIEMKKKMFSAVPQCFSTRLQQERECFENFTTFLYAMFLHWDCCPVLYQFVRDRLVVSIRDQKLLAKLQIEANSPFQEDLESARQVLNDSQEQAELYQDSKADASDNDIRTRETSAMRRPRNQGNEW